MPLTEAQGRAILSTLRTDTQSALARAEAVKDKAESGAVHGVLNFFGLGADNSVDAVPGDLRIQLHALDGFERSLPAAVDDPAKGKTWLESMRRMQKDLRAYASYEETATVDSLLAQTAEATATTVKEGVETAVGFSLKLIPWWGYVVLALVALFFLPFHIFPRRA